MLRNVLVEEPSANGTLRMVASDLENTREIKPKSLEGRYPRWRDVLPKYDSGNSTTISVDPEYMAEVFAVLAKMTGEESHSVELTVPHDNERAVQITLKRPGIQATAVVMPLARER